MPQKVEIEVETYTKFQGTHARIVTNVPGHAPLPYWLVMETDDGEDCFLNGEIVPPGGLGVVVSEPQVVCLSPGGDLIINGTDAENYSLNNEGELIYEY